MPRSVAGGGSVAGVAELGMTVGIGGAGLVDGTGGWSSRATDFRELRYLAFGHCNIHLLVHQLP